MEVEVLHDVVFEKPVWIVGCGVGTLAPGGVLFSKKKIPAPCGIEVKNGERKRRRRT